MRVGFILLGMLLIISCVARSNKKISKNGMQVSWKFSNSQIHFQMEAPTTGWLAIGFNTQENMTGTYLLMGKVENNQVTLVEHYTSSPGNYKPLTAYNVTTSVASIKGMESIHKTNVKFSLPIHPKNKYARELGEGNSYIMTLAFSQSDDFQHHSIMRTAINVKL